MQTVCLIGKPNVGKSTIFNRLIKEKKSIIMDTPGVTRDRIYGIVNLKDKAFHLIDTGGLSLENGDFNKDILAQAILAIDEADLILFIVDATCEISTEDKMVASMLHKSNKKVLVLVNKADNKERQNNLYNFYELGFEEMIAISAEHNIGFDKLNSYLEANISEGKEKEDNRVKFCFVGRPNVGKSSLVNALLKEDRLIVSDIAGTTRDAVDSIFKYNGNEYVVIDTAGMRKKGKIYEQIEKYSYIRSLKAIDRSDVCVLVIDAKEGIIEHDKHIASYALEAGKPLVLVVNKWDTVKDKTFFGIYNNNTDITSFNGFHCTYNTIFFNIFVNFSAFSDTSSINNNILFFIIGKWCINGISSSTSNVTNNRFFFVNNSIN